MGMNYQVTVGVYLELEREMTQEQRNEFFEQFEDVMYWNGDCHPRVLLPNHKGPWTHFDGYAYSDSVCIPLEGDIKCAKALFADKYKEVIDFFGASNCRVCYGVVSYHA